MDAQMKKGILEMCLLHELSESDRYGYELMQKMKQYFPEVNESSFYVILRRLHKEGYTDIYYGASSDGPRRKYYHITEEGQAYLAKAISDLRTIKSIVRSLGLP